MSLRDVLEAALRAQENGEPAALVTVVSTEGSTPRKAGAKMLVYGDGRTVGTIGGGCLESDTTALARRALAEGRVTTATCDLTGDSESGEGLVCGGRVQVLIEPLEPAPTLCLFGAGHVAQPLARMAKACGFRVEVADDRPAFADRGRFPDADRVVVARFAAAAVEMTLGPGTYAVVVARGHRGDAEALRAVLGRGLRFIGLLGSRSKLAHVLGALAEEGVAAEELARVHCPLGLALGAETPAEIAVSILAEMIAVRHGVDPAQGVRSLKAALPEATKVGARQAGRPVRHTA
jgi:xanthine dehydrogenase accessory factor